MIVYSNSPKDTQKLAVKMAEKIVKGPSSPTSSLKLRSSRRLRRASVVTLEGELGAGKTTFVQAFVKALGVKAKVKSPTFVLMKEYEIPDTQQFIYHLDCYRARDHRDLATLDLKTIFNTSGNIVLIEWPERISKILPKKIIRIHIDHIDKNKRKITVTK